MIPTSSEFLNITKSKQEIIYKIGKVTGVFSNNTAKVTFDGESIESIKQYSYLNKYIPTIGDRVLLLKKGGTYIILGKISYNVDPTTL